ncbi:hypothetical protein EJB05_20341 [Eragrostis curvula]|uniref:Protein kinase domain-containing protein n=1 Tax=Eragrostis curvula TaxID=38414 RepID=A0A5J9V028_9POAL|nr:hypothetical protein EJB05_20341 [Eragrostis curvula]
MAPWWGKSSSKEAKKTTKENLIDTIQRLISSNEHKGSRKSRGSRRRDKDTAADKGCWSTAQSRSTSPSKEVSRCQSFAADRPLSQPLPLPGSRGRVTRTTSDITNSKPSLEKRDKGQLLPLPKPNRRQKRPETTEPVVELATASVSSNCSIDSDDPGDSQLQSPAGNDAENATRVTSKSNSSDKGEMCAMKEVTLFSDDPKSKESARQLCQEISLLSRLQHPNIVRYYGSETVDDKLYIYLEYVSGGSIHKLLQEYGQFGEQAIRSYTKQILLGLAYLHAKNTVHRLLLCACYLIFAFGYALPKCVGISKINGQQCPFSFKGSPYWMAPEVIKNSSGCNLAVDIWSLGCTVLEMATSKPPWSQYEGIAAMFKIGNSKELPPIPDHLSEEGKDFIRQCLQRDPSSRPTAVDLLQHPFVRNASVLEKSVASNPLEQLAAISCKSNSKVVGHARNMSSLGLEGQSIYQRRAAKFSLTHSDLHIRSNISCPVSPCGSPLLRSRSPQHQNGRMSPSPISSPRTTSGASTPLTGGNGAIPLNHARQPAYRNDGFTITSRGIDDHLPSRPADPVRGRFVRVQQVSAGLPERVVSEADILSSQFGKMGPVNVWDLHDRQLPSEHSSRQNSGDRVKLKPSLDLTSAPLHFGRNHGH